jgi:hypothetical protein
MSSPLNELDLNGNKWQFLSHPHRYVVASEQRGDAVDLVKQSTTRQFRTAKDVLSRLTGSHGRPARRGVLLADDVGLGKTTIGALVAWVFAGCGQRVRILAPNDTLKDRWTKELIFHVALMNECAPRLTVHAKNIKTNRNAKLGAGSIHVAKHSHAARGATIDCDLLIVDEAHRAKGDSSAFSRALRTKVLPWSVAIRRSRRSRIIRARCGNWSGQTKARVFKLRPRISTGTLVPR